MVWCRNGLPQGYKNKELEEESENKEENGEEL